MSFIIDVHKVLPRSASTGAVVFSKQELNLAVAFGDTSTASCWRLFVLRIFFTSKVTFPYMLHYVSDQYVHASACLCCFCVLPLCTLCVRRLILLSKTVSCAPLFYLIAVLTESTAELAAWTTWHFICEKVVMHTLL